MRNISPVYVGVFLLSAIGVWGCSQQKTGAISAKVTELEARYAKLEDEHRTLQTHHDQHRKKLTQIENQRNAFESQNNALEKEKSELAKQVDQFVSELDRLNKLLAQRTQERDSAQLNLMQFSKDLQALAGRVEAALNNNSPNPNAAIIPASRSKIE